MIEFLLMGAQAAGMAADIAGQGASQEKAEQALDIEERQMGVRMQQDRIASQEQSIFALRNLEEVLASQRAISAARGVLPGAGSMRAIGQKSIGAFNKDEQARNFSLSFLDQQRKAEIAMKRIGLQGQKKQAEAGLLGRAFQMIPFSAMAGGGTPGGGMMAGGSTTGTMRTAGRGVARRGSLTL